MVRLTVLAVTSVVALVLTPVYAEGPGDVLQGIGRAMNGEPSRAQEQEWRDRERERAHWREQRHLDTEQRDLDARRRALQDQRRYEEGYGPSR
jgi:hypothetical protein